MKSVRKIYYRSALVLGVVVMTAIGAGVGFVISFGACFKSDCSDFENGAPVILPAIALVGSSIAAFRLWNSQPALAAFLGRHQRLATLLRVAVGLVGVYLLYWWVSQIWT